MNTAKEVFFESYTGTGMLSEYNGNEERYFPSIETYNIIEESSNAFLVVISGICDISNDGYCGYLEEESGDFVFIFLKENNIFNFKGKDSRILNFLYLVNKRLKQEIQHVREEDIEDGLELLGTQPELYNFIMNNPKLKYLYSKGVVK
jgi:hypothetical protein